MAKNEERIVMTPMVKEPGHTVLSMERKKVEVDKNLMHEAGGNHKGIVISKKVETNGTTVLESGPQLSLSFKVFLVNGQTNVHTQERRQLRFWFKPSLTIESDQTQCAQNFFRDLVNPSEFPRDYVGYIMRIMKLQQHKYPAINRLEVEMKQVQELSEPPSRPMSVDENNLGQKIELTEEKVLELIESSYPNAISLVEIAIATRAEEEEVHFFLVDLLAKNIIKSMDNGLYIRVTQNDTEIKLVKQMPKVVRAQQPTIAIITAQYCEKLAVDAMIDNQDTYVRYKTEGESNIYTLGNIGYHRVVSTKLPTIGHSREAMIAAGNTTTRLLGTFQRVEHVFLVGLGGGVPHFTDYHQHVRLGDVVVSSPPPNPSAVGKPYIYLHCEKVEKSSPEKRSSSPNAEVSVDNFSYRSWCPPSLDLQNLAKDLLELGQLDEKKRSWEKYIEDGLTELDGQETDFQRPLSSSDKLYMSIGTKDVIEVQHPDAPANWTAYDPRSKDMPKIHFGAVASGRLLVKEEQVRQEVASKFGIKAFDSEFDTVAESVFGNRKDRYIFIRGISDYKDGTRKKDWQPYAALVAAAFMKSLIVALPAIEE